MTNWQRFRAAGEQALQQGRLKEAESMWMAALAETEDFQPLDTRKAVTYEGLGEAFYRQGNYPQAQNFCHKLLALYEKMLGTEHPDVGVTASNLAMLHHLQLHFTEAEPLYKQSIAIKTKNLGASHPEVLSLLDSYADILMKTHREAEAQHLKRCAQGMSTGKWNRSGRWNTADVQTAAANSAPAAPSPSPSVTATQDYPLPALNPNQAVIGGSQVKPVPPSRPALNNLMPRSVQTSSLIEPVSAYPGGALNQSVGVKLPPQLPQPPQSAPSSPPQLTAPYPQRETQPLPPQQYAQPMPAQPPHQQQQQMPPQPAPQPPQQPQPQPPQQPQPQPPPPQQQPPQPQQQPPQPAPKPRPDPTSPYAIWETYKDFAEEAVVRKQAQVAATQWRLAIKEAENFPKDNPRLAWTLDCLGDLLCRVQEFEEAEQVLSRCLEIKIEVLGEQHSTVAISISNLARLHYGRKNYSQAESLLLDSLRIYERVLGEQHPETASALYNLAMIYHQQGQFNAAEGVYNRCWQIRKNTLGPDHPDTKKVFDNYSKVLAAKAQMAPPAVPAAPPVPVKPVPASGLIRSTSVSKNEPVRTGVGEITGSWKVLQLPDELSLRADDN